MYVLTDAIIYANIVYLMTEDSPNLRLKPAKEVMALIADNSAFLSGSKEILEVCGIKIIPGVQLERIVTLSEIDQLIEELSDRMPDVITEISREVRTLEEKRRGLEHYSPTSPTILTIMEDMGRWKAKLGALRDYRVKLLDKYNELERLNKKAS